MKAKGTLKPAPYSITSVLSIGPCRGAGGPTIGGLLRLGFTHVIDLNADYSERSLSRRAGITYHAVKATDAYGLKTWLKKLQTIVDIVEKATDNKEKVYLHCTYGKGRSPTAAMAYLISTDTPLQAAIESVKMKAELVWDEGNPVPKYERILRAYSDSVRKLGTQKA